MTRIPPHLPSRNDDGLRVARLVELGLEDRAHALPADGADAEAGGAQRALDGRHRPVALAVHAARARPAPVAGPGEDLDGRLRDLPGLPARAVPAQEDV